MGGSSTCLLDVETASWVARHLRRDPQLVAGQCSIDLRLAYERRLRQQESPCHEQRSFCFGLQTRHPYGSVRRAFSNGLWQWLLVVKLHQRECKSVAY